jgi:N-acetylneuraminic acid mutarotase
MSARNNLKIWIGAALVFLLVQETSTATVFNLGAFWRKVSLGGSPPADPDSWTPTAGGDDGGSSGAPVEGYYSYYFGPTYRAFYNSPNYVIAGASYSPAVASVFNPTLSTWTTYSDPLLVLRLYPSTVMNGSKAIIFGGVGTAGTGIGAICDTSNGTWTYTSTTNAPSERNYHVAVWTGSKMVIWGGNDNNSTVNTGAVYDPSGDTWSTMTTTSAPSARVGATGVWSGTYAIVWGGNTGFLNTNTGGRYNPSTNTWASTTTTGAPTARRGHTAVWTGSKMIVWGGFNSGAALNTGAVYDPSANSWTAVSTTNAPAARAFHHAVWTGSKMFVWGGYDGATELDSGGLYDPGTNTWTTIANSGFTAIPPGYYSFLTGITGIVAATSGTEVLVWGGSPAQSGRYNIAGNSWTQLYTPSGGGSLPRSNLYGSIVWTGTQMIVWGGVSDIYGTQAEAGMSYTKSTETWDELPQGGTPPAVRTYNSSVWTGSKMIIWGGLDFNSGVTVDTGYAYNPANGTWSQISNTGAPVSRQYHISVWTGSKMIVWGGVDDSSSPMNTGGLYNPTTDTWSAMTTTNAPTARTDPMYVWTGTKLIVWGGTDAGGYVNTGNIYDPSSNTWTTMSTVGAPTARSAAGVAYAAGKFIVWGGYDGSTVLGDGAKYDVAGNSWSSVSVAGAPSPRQMMSAASDGTKMIVWGGGAGDMQTFYHDGFTYNPATDIWVPITSLNAPAGRMYHYTLWTGSQMLVWGGLGGFIPPYTVILPTSGAFYTPAP